MNYLIPLLHILFLIIALVFLFFDVIYVKEVDKARDHLEVNLSKTAENLLRINAISSAVGVIIISFLFFLNI